MTKSRFKLLGAWLTGCASILNTSSPRMAEREKKGVKWANFIFHLLGSRLLWECFLLTVEFCKNCKSMGNCMVRFSFLNWNNFIIYFFFMKLKFSLDNDKKLDDRREFFPKELSFA